MIQCMNITSLLHLRFVVLEKLVTLGLNITIPGQGAGSAGLSNLQAFLSLGVESLAR